MAIRSERKNAGGLGHLRDEHDRMQWVLDNIYTMASKEQHIGVKAWEHVKRLCEGIGCQSRTVTVTGRAEAQAAAGAEPTAALTIRLAKEATNGWACYAKRKIEHDEIARLHKAIAEAESKQIDTRPHWEPHDDQCESELTSHGYSPCRCHERAGICYCRKNPCECLPDRLARLRVADLEGK